MDILAALRKLTESLKEWAESKFAQKGEASTKLTEIILPAANWIGDGNPWCQAVECDGLTTNSKPDLQPNPGQIVELQEAEISLMATNESGVAKVYAFNNKPQNDIVMQMCLTAMPDGTDIIYGNIVGGSSGLGNTFLLEDEDGNQVVGVVVDNVTLFTAEDDDVAAGKVYAGNNGVSTGTHTCE